MVPAEIPMSFDLNVAGNSKTAERKIAIGSKASQPLPTSIEIPGDDNVESFMEGLYPIRRSTFADSHALA